MLPYDHACLTQAGIKAISKDKQKMIIGGFEPWRTLPTVVA